MCIVYMCLRVYVCACVYVYMYVYTCACVYMCAHLCVYVCTSVYICVHLYICAYMCFYVRLCELAHIHVCVYTFTYVFIKLFCLAPGECSKAVSLFIPTANNEKKCHLLNTPYQKGWIPWAFMEFYYLRGAIY